MEILKENYELLLPDLMEKISKADFVVLDTLIESTGLVKREKLNYNLLREDDWYSTVQKNQNGYSNIMLGFAIFTKNPENNNNYNVECFNVPILCFAIIDKSLEPDQLSLNVFGLRFLQGKNFDFNKVFYGGVPFMNKERKEETISFMRKYPNFMTRHDKKGFVVDSDYFPKIIDNMTEEDIENAIKRLKGISSFFDVVKEAKIPIIGHDLCLKLVLLYKDLVALLPESYQEFSQKFQEYISDVYDTKVIASELGDILSKAGSEYRKFVKEDLLFDLHKCISCFDHQLLPEITFGKSCEIYMDDLNDLKTVDLESIPDSFLHEPGFDALSSGLSFVKMCCIAKIHFELEDEEMKSSVEQWKNKFCKT